MRILSSVLLLSLGTCYGLKAEQDAANAKEYSPVVKVAMPDPVELVYPSTETSVESISDKSSVEMGGAVSLEAIPAPIQLTYPNASTSKMAAPVQNPIAYAPLAGSPRLRKEVQANCADNIRDHGLVVSAQHAHL
jgi:hypothetical protein